MLADIEGEAAYESKKKKKNHKLSLGKRETCEIVSEKCT